MTKLVYSGPEGQSNPEVGQETGEGDFLEPGRVYDLSPELAERLDETSAFWNHVSDYDRLSKTALLSIAAEQEIEGRSSMDKDALVAAIRANEGNAPEPEPEGAKS